MAAMADASGRDLSRFMRWYGQAGTPELTVAATTTRRHSATRSRSASARRPPPASRRSCRSTFPCGRPRRPRRERAAAPARGRERAQGHRPRDRADRAQPALHLPRRRGRARAVAPARLLRPGEARRRLRRGRAGAPAGARQRPVRALGRRPDALAAGAAAPDRRPARPGPSPAFDPRLPESFAVVLERAAEDRAFAARALQLPSGTYLGQQMAEIDVDGIAFALRLARSTARRRAARALAGRVPGQPARGRVLDRDRGHGPARAQEHRARLPRLGRGTRRAGAGPATSWPTPTT